MAGADLFLMPSRFEPCGITQMLALKYGTLPIVHRTGGLADTVTCWSKTQGNGFLFENYNAGDLIKVVQEALSVFAEQKLWHHLMHNAMAADFSWEKSARDYILLYESLLKQ